MQDSRSIHQLLSQLSNGLVRQLKRIEAAHAQQQQRTRAAPNQATTESAANARSAAAEFSDPPLPSSAGSHTWSVAVQKTAAEATPLERTRGGLAELGSTAQFPAADLARLLERNNELAQQQLAELREIKRKLPAGPARYAAGS